MRVDHMARSICQALLCGLVDFERRRERQFIFFRVTKPLVKQ